MSNVILSSDDWKTPKVVLDRVGAFDFDPCPFHANFDGLKISWFGRVYCNPPYSDIWSWVYKAREERRNTKKIVMLLPVWPRQSWYQGIRDQFYCYVFSERLSFEGVYGYKGNATFDSMLVFIKR